MPDEADFLTIVTCADLAPETKAALASLEFTDVRLHHFPADCGHPQKPERLRAILDNSLKDGGDVILLAGGCAFSAADDALPPNCRVYRKTNCFEFFVDRWYVDELVREGAFILTPGWVATWKGKLADWGFDRETAKEFFAESAQSFVLLDTGVSDNAERNLREFAEYTGRPCRVVRVGLDHYKAELRAMALDWRQRRLQSKYQELNEQYMRLRADNAMFVDLMTNLTRMDSESMTMENILDVFQMIFAPEKMVFMSVVGNKVADCRTRPEAPFSLSECQELLDGRWDRTPEAEGEIRLRLASGGQVLGLIDLIGIPYPGHIDEYRSLGELIAQVCGLGIANTRMYQHLKLLATTDPLTSLFNRRHFFELAAGEFERSRRYGRSMSAAMLDIDFFKKINDTYGHQAGDRVLSAVAGRVKSTVRSSDICGRYGGEEFVILMPEAGEEVALQVAERIRAVIEAMEVVFSGSTIRVTVSLGVSVLDQGCESLEALFGRSDAALYKAKKTGRNRVCEWEPTMESHEADA